MQLGLEMVYPTAQASLLESTLTLFKTLQMALGLGL
jgi:hypothetical protein